MPSAGASAATSPSSFVTQWLTPEPQISSRSVEPGDYIIANQSFDTSFDTYVYSAQITESPAVDWIEGRHANGSVIAFPDQVVEGSEDAALWFGSNFLYKPVE